MSSFVTDMVDYVATMFSGDISTQPCPLFLMICHAVFLGCVIRPVVDQRPNGQGRRWWLTSVIMHVLFICGGSTITAVFLGKRPGWMVGNMGWFLYAVGWFLGGFDSVRRFCLESPAKFVVIVGHALSRVIFVSSGVAAASEACPGGLVAAVFVPVMDSHGMDWITAPIFTAIEGKPLTDCKDWITPGAGLRNTFWAALLYYILSGRAFGNFLPEPLRFVLANAGVAVPLVYDAVFNAIFKTGTSALGFLEAIIGKLVDAIQAFRDKANSNEIDIAGDKKDL